ncbi:uncharacterized protein LOC116920727 [Daphnia magna]|uniref:uncharacterized protein LOC116920727 n=1 Tax=Daphnia magna TaxID=35525 RepID=UPI0006DE814B|nr:uncharacterized protein LOC116920727 [Daphnia magna]
MFYSRFVVAVFLLSVAYTVLGASAAVDDNDSEESIENSSKEATENGSELSKAVKSLNETSIIKLRDVSSQLQKLKAKVSDNEPVVNKARNPTSRTSDVKLGDENVGPSARTTCFTKNGTTICTPATDCTTTKADTSVKLLKQRTMKAIITAKTPILDISSDTLPKKI